MSEKPLEAPYANYVDEAHAIYLGKNRRLADPVFFPAPGGFASRIGTAQQIVAQEVDKHPDGGHEYIQELMWIWGSGHLSRFPPGGPAPSLNDYEKAMKAMAAEVYETWNKIQALVRNHEDDIQIWVVQAYPRPDSDREKNPLRTLLRLSWLPTVHAFNNCHPDIRMFMENKDTESDFQLEVPDGKVPQKFPFSFINHFFLKSREVDRETDAATRDRYAAVYRFPYNFYDHREPKDWPHRADTGCFMQDGGIYNHPDSRAWYRRSRLSFLVPDLTLSELENPIRLLSFIHARGRQHPSLFAKIDSDMTYIGRRTSFLTGPFIANRMVSFEHSGPDSVKGYQPRLWRGYGGKPEPGCDQAVADEYANLWHRGQLFGTSEAWVMLQSQRATYLYLWNLLTTIATDLKLDPRTGLVPRPAEEQEQVFTTARTRTISLQSRYLNRWMYYTRQQPFLSPPTAIDARYLNELQNKVEIAEAHLQDLFSDPEYFFDRIHELRDHHWGHVGMKNAATNPDESDEKASYLEQYADEKTRYVLYFDLIRGVVRRSIFEFYMWHSIHSRLLEFDNAMKAEFEDYGKKDDSDSDGTNMLQQPPVFLSPKKKLEHASVSDKYLALIVMLRYHAVFFVNEFRKKGIHAGCPSMRDIAYSVGEAQKPTPDRICNIVKEHYGAPDLKHQSKLRAPWRQLSKAGGENIRCSIFEAIDTFIANPLESTNTGIKDAAAVLQEMTQHPSEQLKSIFTELLDDTIDGLDLLSSLADHLEYLWPAMDVVGGADATEADRRKWFDMGSKDVSINFLNFDAFDFDDKVPMKRLKRLFLFFDELQGFKKESVSVGHAKGDLRRFGASLLGRLIYPLNEAANGNKANQEAMSRLERAMNVTGAEYVYHEKEQPFNLDEEEAGFGVTVSLVDQPRSYRNVAAHERQLAKERQAKRDELIERLIEPSKEEAAKAKKREKKKARKKDKARRRQLASGEPVPDDDDGGDEDEEMPDAQQPPSTAAPNDARWEESLHAMLQQFQLPPVPETRILSISGEQTAPAPPSPSSSSKPLPKAPDGRPKRIMKKREWATLEAVHGIHGSVNAAVSYAQLRAMMGALGYEEVGRGGSHMSYSRVDGRWPHSALPKGETIQLARTHGRDHAAAAKGKARDWGRRLCERGLTFEFVKQWFVKG
ncbi:hypothetical protein CCMA1212_005431 [Trichoderma ghanense]|uniref:Uncharacterized protein n=1 Tax=Trichoderma ghanense TaxID=65468 RepID=A0ABY2H407_9HYPO